MYACMTTSPAATSCMVDLVEGSTSPTVLLSVTSLSTAGYVSTVLVFT